VINQFLVSSSIDGKQIQILNPKYRLTPDEALNLAAWLVALAQPQTALNFADILDEVRKS